MRGLILIAVLAMSFVGLGACSSFDGMPKPVVPVETATAIASEYQIDAALKAVRAATSDEDKIGVRNRTIAIYLNAADARYHAFRSNLAKDLKGTNLGLDLGALTFSTLGAVTKNAANELSAGAALMTGAKGSINKELYFERTLPALLATMDGNRFRARAVIMGRMRETVATYPLEMAFSDLSAYEMAASLDGAVQQLTADANRSTAEAFQTYTNAVDSCQPDVALRPYWLKLNHKVYTLAKGADNGPPVAGSPQAAALQSLSDIAKSVGAEPSDVTTTPAAAQAQAAAITLAAGTACSVKQIETLFAKIKTDTKVDIP